MQCSIAASPRLPVWALGEIATLLISKVALNDESGAFRAGTPKLLVGRGGQVGAVITYVPSHLPHFVGSLT